MKTLFNIIAVIAKITTIVMAIVGVVLTIVTMIIGNTYIDHVYDVVEECDPLAPDDEAQGDQLTAEAFRRTMADPRVKNSKFIKAVDWIEGEIASFVANL